MSVPGGDYAPVLMQVAGVEIGNGTAAEALSGVSGAYTTLTMQVTGISGDTLTFEATVDDTNWVAVLATSITSGTAATTATADGIYRVTCLGLRQVRARISTYSAGTIYVTGYLVA